MYTENDERVESTEEWDEDYEDTTVGDLCESIETNLWLAEGYFRQGASGLANECLRSAWHEYIRFRDVLGVYAGRALGERLVAAVTTRANESAASLALGDEAAAAWRELAAA